MVLYYNEWFFNALNNLLYCKKWLLIAVDILNSFRSSHDNTINSATWKPGAFSESTLFAYSICVPLTIVCSRGT